MWLLFWIWIHIYFFVFIKSFLLFLLSKVFMKTLKPLGINRQDLELLRWSISCIISCILSHQVIQCPIFVTFLWYWYQVQNCVWPTMAINLRSCKSSMNAFKKCIIARSIYKRCALNEHSGATGMRLFSTQHQTDISGPTTCHQDKLKSEYDAIVVGAGKSSLYSTVTTFEVCKWKIELCISIEFPCWTDVSSYAISMHHLIAVLVLRFC